MWGSPSTPLIYEQKTSKATQSQTAGSLSWQSTAVGAGGGRGGCSAPRPAAQGEPCQQLSAGLAEQIYSSEEHL